MEELFHVTEQKYEEKEVTDETINLGYRADTPNLESSHLEGEKRKGEKFK